jgi:conjugative transfer region lipoprotein (TIGR03751 family)
MQRTWTERCRYAVLAPIALALATTLSGCATNTDDLLSHDSSTMRDIWDQKTGAGSDNRQGNRLLLDARLALRRPLNSAPESLPTKSKLDFTGTVDNANYTRTARNEIQRQFQRLPNPDLVMYVFPHLAGTDPVPIPGYSTVFPLYQRVQYAMPGERVEDY